MIFVSKLIKDYKPLPTIIEGIAVSGQTAQVQLLIIAVSDSACLAKMNKIDASFLSEFFPSSADVRNWTNSAKIALKTPK